MSTVSGRVRTEARAEHVVTADAGRRVATALQESASVDVKGNVYHDRLVRYAGGTTLALAQQASESGGRSGGGSATLADHDLAATVLPQHSCPLTVSTRHAEDVGFAGFLDAFGIARARSDSWDATLDVRQAPLSASFSERHGTEAFESPGQDRDDTRRSRDAAFRYVLGSRSHLAAAVSDATTTESTERSRSELTTRGASVAGEAGFGGSATRPAWHVAADVRADRQTGDSDRSTESASGAVTWRPLDELTSRTGFGGRRFAAAGATGRSIDVSEVVQHRLFESLVTTVDARAGHDEVDGGAVHRGEFAGELDYTKDTPLGRLSLDFRAGRANEEDDIGPGRASVIGERHVLSSASVALLTRPGADTAALRVTDPAGSIVYVRGSDYGVAERGARTEIFRIAGGRIADGGEVLVDYTFLLPGGGARSTTTRSAGVSLRPFEFLEVHARRGSTTRSGDRRPRDPPFEGETTHAIGAAATWEGLDLRAETVGHASGDSPYVQRRVEASYAFDLAGSSHAALGATWFATDHADRGEVTMRSVIARMESGRGPLHALLEAGLRRSTGRAADRDLLDAGAGFSYAYRQLHFRLGVRQQREVTPGRSRSESLVEFSVERAW